jgi:hypothetical protein
MKRFLILLFAIFPVLSISQVKIDGLELYKGASPAVPNDIFPGSAVMIAGDLWDSFLPIGQGVYYSETANNPAQLWDLIRIGNFDRQWSTPTAQWPGGYPISYFWAQDIMAVEYSPGINPSKIRSSSENYAFMIYTNKLDALFGRSPYFIGPIWIKPDFTPDPTGEYRYALYYESGFPTNLGVWVTVRILQFTQNWNNFNDFIVVGITFKNYGILDVNADGTPEKTNNRINALVVGWFSEVMHSAEVGVTGRRTFNRFGSGRNSGYIADPDQTNSPWATLVSYAGVNPANYASYPDPNSVPQGKRDMGLNAYPLGWYTDVWFGRTFLAVKADTIGLPSAPDKKTIFDSHPIGTGPERGWYLSAGTGRGGLDNRNDAKLIHTILMGTWYKDGGKSNSTTLLDLNPNPNYFQSGTPGDPLSFVPKPVGQRGKPDGDKKSTNVFENVWEDGWTKGYSAQHNFDGDAFIGCGPFSLDVGEAITIIAAEYAGFRLPGLLRSLQAVRWAYENNFQVPAGPGAPDIKVEITDDNKVLIRWKKSPNENDPNFGGYKIYRASAFPKFKSTDIGFRVLQRYNEQMEEGEIKDEFKDPINPKFDAFGALKEMQAGFWGPYKVRKIIPKSQLSQYASPSGGYDYAFKDDALDVLLGFSYWYYVSAYRNLPSPITINGRTTNVLESGRVNVNGASGLWEGTYPWATQNSFYPTTADGQKRIGATVVVKSRTTSPEELASGAKKVGVRPNPYKKGAFHDIGTQHKLLFYNLPSKCTITILDVSGQIIDRINFTAPNPNDGTYTWDMFSKDGIEVANGLYIYVVEYEGGKQVGYFAILR